MYSGPALRELTVYERVRQDTGNFNSVLKGLGVRTWHCVRQSPALSLVVRSWGVFEGNHQLHTLGIGAELYSGWRMSTLEKK